MMKKMLCYFTACVLILACIAGCVTPGTTEPSAQLGADIPTTGSEPSVDITFPGLELPEKAAMPVAEREEAGALIDYDPNRELYILTGTHDYTYYIGFYSDIWYGFYILSKKPLDVNSISLHIPVEHPYTVYVKEITLEGAVTDESETANYSATQFPYELYQCYQGKDFQKLSELYREFEYRKEVWSCANRWLKNLLNTEENVDAAYQKMVDNLYAEYQAAERDYVSCLDAEREAYYALKKDDLPQFYVYSVQAAFDTRDIDHIPDETFTEVTVTIGDQVYRQQIGQITLKSESINAQVFAQRDWVNNGYNADDGIFGYGNYPLPYNDGVHIIRSYFNIDEVDSYKLLTKLELDDPNQKLEAVWIEVWPEGGTKSYYYYWDMSEPFELYPGDMVRIDIVYSDAHLKDDYLGYRTKVLGYLEYESEGETWYKISECGLSNTMNLYVLYAIIFDGLDMESYYWDYYYPNQEGWRFDPELSPWEKLPVVSD